MKKLIKKIPKVSSVIVIMLIMIAMTVSGLNAAERVFNYNKTTQTEPTVVEESILESAPPSPEELPGNMNSDGQPNCEQTAYLSAAGFANNIEIQKRIKFQKLIQSLDAVISYDKSNQNQIKSSIFLISTDKGLEFTLVGAKPSGTS